MHSIKSVTDRELLPHTGRVIQDIGSLHARVHRAVQRALSGGKSDADAAGRLLLAIPAHTSGAVLLEVETVLMRADPRFWIALEDARDWLYWEEPGKSIHQLTGADTVPAVSVKAMFADGRVREQAVRLLTASGSLAALPVLGLRAADWVPQVREAARDAILFRLADDVDGAALAAIAPMALLLAGRWEGRWLAEYVTRRLAEASSERVVTRLLESPDLRLRRTAYQVLADSGTLDLKRAVDAAVSDRDIVIRVRCAEFAKRLARDAGSIVQVRRMLASSTPVVRAEALVALNRLGDVDAVRDALPDRSGLVRGTARFCLRPHGIDVADTYRRLLGSEPEVVTPGAVAGLAEVGTATDVDLINPLLDHPRVKVRVEAIRAICRLASAIDTGRMLALISENPSPAIIREATSAIIAHGAGLEPERLLALLEPSRPVPVRLAVRRLFASRDTAWRLAVDVALLADPDETVAEHAKNDLKAAMQQQLYTRPSGQAAEMLSTHLADADRLLAPPTARLLRFILGMPRAIDPDGMADATDAATQSPTAIASEPRRLRWLRRR